jgi:FKBP-type peptidyl-prolyl cis-trans isomerase
MPMCSRRSAVFTLAVISGGAAIATPALAQAGKPVTTASGLQIIDTKVGTGASPRTGQTCVMHYTGWLYDNGAKGKKFDSSVDRGEPFEFKIGTRQVIAGWDEGVASMKVGGKRTLIIPAALGYGAQGAGNVIPPNATLMFDVELLGIKQAKVAVELPPGLTRRSMRTSGQSHPSHQRAEPRHGLPGHQRAKRRRSSNGYARQ